jgi:hypothetical protein
VSGKQLFDIFNREVMTFNADDIGKVTQHPNFDYSYFQPYFEAYIEVTEDTAAGRPGNPDLIRKMHTPITGFIASSKIPLADAQRIIKLFEKSPRMWAAFLAREDAPQESVKRCMELLPEMLRAYSLSEANRSLKAIFSRPNVPKDIETFKLLFAAFKGSREGIFSGAERHIIEAFLNTSPNREVLEQQIKDFLKEEIKDERMLNTIFDNYGFAKQPGQLQEQLFRFNKRLKVFKA